MSNVGTFNPTEHYASGVGSQWYVSYIAGDGATGIYHYGYILEDSATTFSYEMRGIWVFNGHDDARWYRVYGPMATTDYGGVYTTIKCPANSGGYINGQFYPGAQIAINSGVWRYVVTKGHSAQTIIGYWRVDVFANSACTDRRGQWIFAVYSNADAKASYTVKYVANGGSSTPGSQTKWHNENLTLAGAISRANASAGSYTVTLNGNGGSNPNALSAARTTKYTFSSWKASNGTTYAKSATYSANAGTTMTAQWSSSTTTAAVTLPTPSRSGFTWVRWNTKSDNSGTGYSGGASYTPTAAVTLYAIWKHKVTYNANDGSGAPSAQEDLATKAITLSSTKPTFTGYTFKRWNTNASDTGTGYNPGGSFAAQAASVTLYAIWNRTVTFDANGGSGAPVSQTGVRTSALTLTTSKPTRSEYTFLYWNTKTDGTGTTYNSGGSYPAKTASATLYAVWGPAVSITSVTRTNAQGVADVLGGCAKVTFTVSNQAKYAVTVGSISVNAVQQSNPGTYSVIVPGTLSTLDPRTAYNVTVTATDSNDRAVTATTTLPVSDYAAPKILSILSERSDEYGNSSDDGEYLKVTMDWSAYASLSQSVYMTFTAVDDKKKNQYYTNTVLTAPGGTTMFLFPNGLDDLPSLRFSTEQQYLLKFEIFDLLNSVKGSDMLSRAYFTMDVLGDNYLYQASTDASMVEGQEYYRRVNPNAVGSEAYEEAQIDMSGYDNLARTIDAVATPTTYNALNIKLDAWLVAEQVYTLQLWDVNVSHSAKAAADLGVAAYYCGGNVVLGNWLGEGVHFTNGHADHLVVTFTPHESEGTTTSVGSGGTAGLNHTSVTSATEPFIRLYNSVPNVSGTLNLTVGAWKLETGYVGTELSEAVGDIDFSKFSFTENILLDEALKPASWAYYGAEGSLKTRLHDPEGYEVSMSYETVNSWEISLSPAISVIPGRAYTFSMDYAVDQDYYLRVSNIPFGLEICDAPVTNGATSSSANVYASIDFPLTTTVLTRESVTFVPTTTIVYLVINGGNIGDNQEVSFTIGHLMLEKGDEASDWVEPSRIYAKIGPRPGHGVAFGLPVSKEGFHVGMPLYLGNGTDEETAIYFNGQHRCQPAIKFCSGSDEWGDGIIIGDGGAVVIGSGESASSLVSDMNIAPGTENMYVTSDVNIEFYTNCNTIANRRRFVMTKDDSFLLYSGSLKSGTVPSAMTSSPVIQFKGSDGTTTAQLLTRFQTDGREGMQLECYRKSPALWHGFGLYIDADGNRTVSFNDPQAWRVGLQIGNIKDYNGSNVSVATGNTFVRLGSISLEAGKWLVLVGFYCAGNSSGLREATLTNQSAAGSVGASKLNTVRWLPVAWDNYANIAVWVNPSATTTYYTYGRQTSGAALNMSSYIRAIRLQ